jgi:hypothetical protein
MKNLLETVVNWLERHANWREIEDITGKSPTFCLIVTPRTNVIVRATASATETHVYSRHKSDAGRRRGVSEMNNTFTVVFGSQLATTELIKEFNASDNRKSQLVMHTDFNGNEPPPTYLSIREAVLSEETPALSVAVENPLIDVEADVPPGTTVIVKIAAE